MSRFRRLVLALGLTSVAWCQSAAPAATPGPLEADRATISTIIMSSVTQVQLCQFALQKAGTTDVRLFCRNTIVGHERTAFAALQLAQSLGLTGLQLRPLPETSKLLAELSRYSGHEFERTFLLAQIERDENDRDFVRYAAEVATTLAMKRFEDGLLPRIQADLERAEGTLRTVSQDQP